MPNKISSSYYCLNFNTFGISPNFS